MNQKPLQAHGLFQYLRPHQHTTASYFEQLWRDSGRAVTKCPPAGEVLQTFFVRRNPTARRPVKLSDE